MGEGVYTHAYVFTSARMFHYFFSSLAFQKSREALRSLSSRCVSRGLSGRQPLFVSGVGDSDYWRGAGVPSVTEGATKHPAS